MPILELMNYGTIRGAFQTVQWQKENLRASGGAAGDRSNSCVRKIP